MKTHDLRPFAVVALVALALAAATGSLLRFGLILGMPAWAQNFMAVRHAHSHLMYFGWGTLGMMALIWHLLPRFTGRPLPRGVGGQMAATSVVALLSLPGFWSNGYGLTQVGGLSLPLGAMVSGWNGVTWFVFVWLYWRATRQLGVRPLPAQQIGEEVVIAKPTLLIVQRDEKEVAPFQILEDGLRWAMGDERSGASLLSPGFQISISALQHGIT